MATQNSTEYYGVSSPGDKGGRQRIAVFTVAQSGAGADGDGYNLVQMPGGDLRITEIYFENSAFGAGTSLDIGHGGYADGDGNAVAADPEYWVADVDVSGAGNSTEKILKKLQTKAGFTLTARIQGGVIPDGATLNGYVEYITD